MSDQPTEYGKALIEAVARAIERTNHDTEEDFAESWAQAHIRHNRTIEARAALLAACAKLKEPSEAMELAADMAIGRRVDWPE